MPFQITGQIARTSFWSKIWDTLKEEWRRSSFSAKFTFFFRASWSLLALGFMLRSIRLVLVVITTALAIIATALMTILVLFLLGYNFVHPLNWLWIAALGAWVYLKHKYPGQYANVWKQNTNASWVRQSPIWFAGLLTILWFVGSWIIQSISIPSSALGKILVYGIPTLLIIWIVTRLVGQERIVQLGKDYSTDITIILVSAAVIIILNTLAYYLTTANPAAWNWYYGNQSFFWAFNFGWLAVAWLASKKGADGKTIPVAQFGATLITIGLLVGFAYNLYYYRNQKTVQASAISSQPGITPSLGGQANTGDVNHVLSVIAGCESGTGLAGTGKQFLEDGVTPKRNPQNGEPGTGTVGEWQLNQSDPAVLRDQQSLEVEMLKDGRLAQDQKLDVEKNRAHNYEAAKYLYTKYGTAPWTASASCWGPKVVLPGGIMITLQTPEDGKWSSEIELKPGYWTHWGQTKGAIEIDNLQGEIMKFDPANKVYEQGTKPSHKFRFRSLGGKKGSVTAVIELSPTKLAKGAHCNRRRSFLFYSIFQKTISRRIQNK